MTFRALFLPLFLLLSSICAAQQERLIARTRYANNAGVPTALDSTQYIYSGARNIDSSFTTIQDADTTYLWSRNNTTALQVLTGRSRLYHTATGRRSAIYVDRYDSSAHTFTLTTWDTFAFTPAGAPLRFLTYGYNSAVQGFVVNYEDTLLYAASGYDKTEIRYQYHMVNNVWTKDTFDCIFHHYDASGRILSDSDVVLVPYGRSIRVNDLTYNSSGQIDTEYIATWRLSGNTMMPVNMSLYINSFSPAGLLDHTIVYTKNLNTGNWDLSQHYYLYYDISGNLMEQVIQSYDSAGQWVNSSRNVYTYDSYNMPLTRDILNWKATAQLWALPSGTTGYRYYYELYGPTSIPDQPMSNTLNVYPIPASDRLHIDADLHSAQPATINITDLSGREYASWTTGGGTYHGDLPVGQLAEGIYVLRIATAGGEQHRIFNIAR